MKEKMREKPYKKPDRRKFIHGFYTSMYYMKGITHPLLSSTFLMSSFFTVYVLLLKARMAERHLMNYNFYRL
jgi:hypothetical protein